MPVNKLHANINEGLIMQIMKIKNGDTEKDLYMLVSILINVILLILSIYHLFFYTHTIAIIVRVHVIMHILYHK